MSKFVKHDMLKRTKSKRDKKIITFIHVLYIHVLYFVDTMRTQSCKFLFLGIKVEFKILSEFKSPHFLISDFFDVKPMPRCFKPALFIKDSKRNISSLRVRNFGRSLEMAQLKIDSSFNNFAAYLLSFLAFVLKLLSAGYKHYPCSMLALKLPPSTQHQPVPLCWPFLPAWRKSSPLSRSLVCIPVDIHTHTLGCRGMCPIFGPLKSSRLPASF